MMADSMSRREIALAGEAARRASRAWKEKKGLIHWEHIRRWRGTHVCPGIAVFRGECSDGGGFFGAC